MCLSLWILCLVRLIYDEDADVLVKLVIYLGVERSPDMSDVANHVMPFVSCMGEIETGIVIPKIPIARPEVVMTADNDVEFQQVRDSGSGVFEDVARWTMMLGSYCQSDHCHRRWSGHDSPRQSDLVSPDTTVARRASDTQ